MLERLESASLRQRRFVADASHELKTPLAAMRTMLEVARSDPGFEDWPELLASLTSEGERMEGLVSDLLALARFEEGGPLRSRDEVDLDQVLGRVADRTRRSFPAMTVDTSGITPARVRGDAGALERLLWNLASNAGRYGTSRVAFSCEASDTAVVARVADDGPGVPEAERERVFERFVRLDEARDRVGGGTGLGLAVARAIARSHGGEVRITAAPDTTVEVSFPAVRP
jgi:signal transduction histidine kinase